MEDIEAVWPEVQAVVARYLDGKEGFDVAARAIAAIVKRTIPSRASSEPADSSGPKTQPRRIQLQALSLSEWVDPTAPYVPAVHLTGGKTLHVAPGRGPADESRAHHLLGEAMNLLFGPGGDAA